MRPGDGEHRSQAEPRAWVSSLVSSGGYTLRRLDWPVANARGQVCLVHGFAEHAERYDGVARAFTDAGFHVSAVELPGHGKSSGKPGDVRGFEDLLGAVDALWDHSVPDVDPGTRFLLGHSMGGLVALRWVQLERGDPAGLLLSAPWLATHPTLSMATRALKWLLGRIAPGLAIRRPIDSTGLTRDPERQRARDDDPMILRQITARLVMAVEEVQELALRQGPGVDTLVVSPGDDPVTDQEVVRAWALDHGNEVDLVEIPGGKHEPFQDLDREETIRVCVQWATERAASGEPGEGNSPPRSHGGRLSSEDP